MGTMPAPAIQDMALALLRDVPRLRQREDAPDILAAITSAVRQARRAIDRPPSRVYAGPCPACGTDLLAMPGRSVITCPCGQPSVIAERQEAMRIALEDHLGNVTYVIRVSTGLGLPVSENTVRSWIRRHQLEPRHYGQPRRPGGDPVPLYRAGDVMKLAAGNLRRYYDSGQERPGGR